MLRLLATSTAALCVLSLLAAQIAFADEAGEKAFKKNCATCHTVEAGKNKIGPSLAGIIGRKAGSIEGFKYSPANANSGVVWDEAKLDTYLTDPKAFIPGTIMIFAGIKNPQERQAVIQYLKEH